MFDKLGWLESWKECSQAPDDPEAYSIVERTVHQSNELVTADFQSAECTVGAGDSVVEYPVEEFLGGQKVVQQAEEETVVSGVKT